MRFCSVKSSNDLQPYVSSFFQWSSLHSNRGELAAFQIEALPIDLGWSIAFVNGGEVLYSKNSGQLIKLAPVVIAGQQTSSLLTKTADRAEIFGVNFYPASLPLLLSLPANEFTDKIIDAADLKDFGLYEIGELIYGAKNFAEKVIIFEEYLRCRFDQKNILNPDFVQAICILQKSREAIKIELLARECNISARKLERLFCQNAGIGPKRFLRIYRFRRALMLARRQAKVFQRVDWAGIAAHCNFYDQSHLINDFRDLGGLPPQSLINLLDKNAPLSDFSNTETFNLY